MQTVTPRQLDILKYIRDFRLANGYSPTMQEIGDHLSLTKVTVFEHVGALEKKGLILRGAKHKARSLQVCDEFQFPDEIQTRIPLMGKIAAGSPIEAIESDEMVELTELFPPGSNTFALKVAGDSMVDDHICDGDIVICERRNSARDGEVVVALLDTGEATLKRIFRKRGHVELHPANENYEPIIVDSCDIQGVMIGLIRCD